jgi:hypothetical protein
MHKQMFAGTIYHIKLVIADDNSDGLPIMIDSAIFLEAGSFI